MALGPAQVHPQEHLGPVGRLGATRARADREQGRALVVLAREQQRRPFPEEIGLEPGGIAIQLGFELWIGRLLDQLQRGEEVVPAGQQVLPGRDL